MTVLSSRDLKKSLSDDRIVTAQDLQVCLACPAQNIKTVYGPV